MRFAETDKAYGLVSILLHWVIALATIALFALGLWMTGLTYYDRWYNEAQWLHESSGMLLFAALLLRLGWRVFNRKPQPLSMPAWEQRAARMAHAGLDLLLLLVIISGYLISAADGRAVDVFNWFAVPAWLPAIDKQADIAGEFHFYLACGLIGLAGVHSVAALKHHFYDRDATLIRMLRPGSRP